MRSFLRMPALFGLFCFHNNQIEVRKEAIYLILKYIKMNTNSENCNSCYKKMDFMKMAADS